MIEFYYCICAVTFFHGNNIHYLIFYVLGIEEILVLYSMLNVTHERLITTLQVGHVNMCR